MRRSVIIFATAILTAMTAGCGGGDGSSASGFATCSQADQNQRVFEHMQSWYVWTAFLPSSIDPEAYASVEDLLDAITYQPIDRYTFVIPKTTANNLFQRGQFIGIGITTVWVGDRLYAGEVWPGSPADDAGLVRGDELLEINGTTVASIAASGGSVSDAFGADAVGTSVTLRYVDAGAVEHTPTMQKALVTMDTVRFVDTFDVGGSTVGYLNFKAFVAPSVDDLDDAFDLLRVSGVDELVLDLRYNGGGYIYVAQQLASQIGGTITNGQLMVGLDFNAQHQNQNQSLYFNNPSNALDLNRVIVITTGATASASEMVINSLAPFIDVVTVGSTSYGKPVGSNSWDFCGQSLFPITFVTSSAAGPADFYDGFPADCAAVDDLTHALADPAEASLAEALYYVANDSCSVTSERSRRSELARLGAAGRDTRRSPEDMYRGDMH